MKEIRERSIIQEWSILSVPPNWIYRFNAVPVKISGINFVNIDHLILKFMWRCTRPRIASSVLKESIPRTNTIQLQELLWNYSDQESVVLKEYTDRSVEQSTPEKDLQKYSTVIFGQGAKANSLFNKVMEQLDIRVENWISTQTLYFFTKINSKCFTNLNVKCKTIKKNHFFA